MRNIRNKMKRRSLEETAIIYFGWFLLIGFVISWMMVSKAIIWPLLTISFSIILFFAFKTATKWRWGLAGIVLWFVIVDTIRKVMGGNQYFLIISEGIVAFVFLMFILQYYVFGKGGGEKHVLKPMNLILLGFACIVILQSLNPSIPDFILRIAGLRTYLFYIPMIMLGLFAFRSEADIFRAYRFLFFLSIFVIAFSFCQLLSNYSGKLTPIMIAMEHNKHSYGSYTFELISSSFASSKRYGRFLFLVYPYIYGIYAYYNKSKVGLFALFSLFMAAAIISGSREIVVILVLFHSIFWILTSKRQLNRFGKISLMIIIGIAAWYTVLNFESSGDHLTEKNYRFKAILSNQEQWVERFQLYTYETLIDVSRGCTGSELFWGNGIGIHGQEANLLRDSTEIRRPGGDGGIAKLIIELGIIGASYFFIMYFVMLLLIWQKIKEFKTYRIYPMLVALFFVPIGWLILFLKAHTVISDGMMSFGLWFSIGIILSLRYYAATGRFPVIAGRAL